MPEENREGLWQFPCGCIEAIRAVPPGHQEIRISYDLEDKRIEQVEEYLKGGWECERVSSCHTHTISAYGMQRYYSAGRVVYCRDPKNHPKECNDAIRIGDIDE